MSKHGKLKGLFPAADLNPTDPNSERTLRSGISAEKPKKGQKPVLIMLSKAVQAEYRRGTVASAQRVGRVASVHGSGKKHKADTLFDTDSNIDSANIVDGKRRRTAKVLK